MKGINAKYRIEDTFVMSGRGIVLAGTILQDEIQIGDFIVLQIDGNSFRRKISGIEGIRSAKGKPDTGIIIECKGDEEISKFKDWNPKNLIAEITN